MSGQSYHLGEGVAADLRRAEPQYRRACALSPGPEAQRSEAAPCRFALNRLADLALE